MLRTRRIQARQQTRDDFKQISHDTHLAILKHRRRAVFVDGNQSWRFHTAQMIMRAGDARCDVQARLDALASLPHQALAGDNTQIQGSA